MASEARLYRVALPMRIGFDHPAARRRTSDSLVLRLSVDDASGIGECAPRPYVTGETTDSVTEALGRVPLHALFGRLRTTPPADLADRLRAVGFESTFPELFAHTLGMAPGTNLVCLLETAVLDLLCRQLSVSIGELLLPGVPEALSVPVSQVLDLSIGVEEFLDTRGPFHFVKVKASDDIERDVRTVDAIRRRLGADVPVMVDANMSWTPETAAPYARRLREAGMDLVEEPLPRRSWADLRALRRATGVRVLLDESVCTAADARQAVAAGACDAVNVRVSKNGGLFASARLVEYARAEGLGFQIGVQVAETGPLINASRALALRSPDALTVEAGQSDRFFAETDSIVTPRPLVDRRNNTVAPVEGPGLGLVLTEQAARWTALTWTDHGWHPPTASTAVPAPTLAPELEESTR
ncbi:mandelate racemase/muconate lactonizing enzyme family protein [Streptomyces sp. WI04-05B]|uniref:mandelate racemase/muconate lactonizing enzyme family protein n=1 Tax=Streptomyces TaxID=1883 RepID=UPI0029B408AC|nr:MULTISPECIES: enolase C-terminal domain-like protein [unclassified Streptomyces]MDX2541804.1 enolase C-terminal domain-like protein [Streptomyces sp. WI04-05B]MDX2586886.1 enolase C-terminal domain-like protein [Streptomyces sp. WI04-05A]